MGSRKELRHGSKHKAFQRNNEEQLCLSRSWGGIWHVCRLVPAITANFPKSG